MQIRKSCAIIKKTNVRIWGAISHRMCKGVFSKEGHGYGMEGSYKEPKARFRTHAGKGCAGGWCQRCNHLPLGAREISSLNADKVACLANVLQVTPDYLMGWEIPPQEGQLNNVYFNFAREAQENNIDPNDIRIAIDMIRKLKRKHSKK